MSFVDLRGIFSSTSRRRCRFRVIARLIEPRIFEIGWREDGGSIDIMYLIMDPRSTMMCSHFVSDLTHRTA